MSQGSAGIPIDKNKRLVNSVSLEDQAIYGPQGLEEASWRG